MFSSTFALLFSLGERAEMRRVQQGFDREKSPVKKIICLPALLTGSTAAAPDPP